MAKRILKRSQLLKIVAEENGERYQVDEIDKCFDEQTDSEEEIIIEASDVEDEISCESDTEYMPISKGKTPARSRRARIQNTNRKVSAVKRKTSAAKRKVSLVHLESKEFIGKDDTKWAKVPFPELRSENQIKINDQVTIEFIGEDGAEWAQEAFPETISEKQIQIHDQVTIPDKYSIISPIDIFKLFFTDVVCEEIVRFTNMEAIRVGKSIEQWKMVDVVELHAFIGLLIAAGHMKCCNQNYRSFWHPFYGSTLFQATMGLTRFEQLLRFIRFDDKSTRSERRVSDKLCPIRSIWEQVTGKFGEYYIPSDNLTVDEQLMPCRCRCCFIQFMPKKPDKYGIKIFWLCDSKTAYPLKGLVYTGKDGNKRAVGLAGNVVESLCSPYFGTNRNITMDNYFTSLPLAESLLSKGLTLVGTLKKNKTCVPDNFLPNKSKLEGSTMFGFREKMTLVSHVPKVGKAVLLLSSMHHTDKIITEDGQKPISEINKYYNKTKSGVDTMDQMVHEYMTKRKTNRWPFSLFMNLLDVTNIAAYVLWSKKFPLWNAKKSNKRHLFLRALGEDLVSSHIERREKIPQLRKTCRTAISNFFLHSQCSNSVNKSSSSILVHPHESNSVNKSSSSNSLPPDAKRRKCHLCPPQISRKQKQVCNKCKKNVCNEHSISTRQCSACKKP